MTTAAGHATANDLDIHWIEAGSGPLLLCLHGFPDQPCSFRHQLEFFARKGYRVVAPYARGYAPTAIPADGCYMTAALGRDAIALIETLGYEQAVIYGHDWGSAAATAAACLAPERVEKLVFCAVPYGPAMAQALVGDYAQQKRSWYMFFFQTALADIAVPLDDFAFIERLWQDWSPGWDYPREALQAVQQTLAQEGVLGAALGYYRSAIGGAGMSERYAALQASIGGPIEVPALYLHGERDGCIGVELAEGMDSLFPRGLRREIVADAGHFVHQEQPEVFNALLAEFLGV
jgi:pimeloyl-ACP methyl ester carboxylesterase